MNMTRATITFVCFTVTCSGSLAADQTATNHAGQFAAMLKAYDAALATENADALAALYVGGNLRTVRQLVRDWRQTFARFDSLEANSEVKLVGVSGDTALLRSSHRLSGRPTREPDAVHLIADEVLDHLLRRVDGTWYFTGQTWPVVSVEPELRRVLALAAEPGEPVVVDLVLFLRAGSWQVVRSLPWAGHVRALAPVGVTERVQLATNSAAEIHSRRQAGTLHLLTQVEDGEFAPLNPVWLPAAEPSEQERGLWRLSGQVMADFANAQLHERFARRLEQVGLTGLAATEWQKAAALAPSADREAAVRRLAGIVPDGPRQAWDRPSARPAANAASELAQWKPSNVLVSQPFVLRLTPAEPRVSEILASLETLNRQMTQTFGIPLKQAEVSVFASREEFNAFRQRRGETGFPHWSGGVSGVHGILTYSRPGVERSIAHEYAHEAVKQFVGGAPVPVWLDEGIAAVVEGMSDGWQEELRRRHREGRLVPIADLSRPWNALPTELAAGGYAQSRSLAGYLLSTAGREGLLAILTELRRGAAFDQAFARALGTDMAGFQQRWLRATFR